LFSINISSTKKRSSYEIEKSKKSFPARTQQIEFTLKIDVQFCDNIKFHGIKSADKDNESRRIIMRKQLRVFILVILFSLQVSAGMGPGPYYINSTYSGHGNIRIGNGFDQTNKNIIIDALNNIYNNNFGFHLPNNSGWVDPYNEIIGYIRYIFDTTRDDVWGYTTGNGYMWMSYRLIIDGYYGSFGIASIMQNILHEADHHRYGSHSCGSGADVDDNGPFGVAAYYLMKLYHNSPTLDENQRNQAASLGLGRAYNNMCGNQDALNRVLYAYTSNVFPAPPDPTPPENCEWVSIEGGAVLICW